MWLRLFKLVSSEEMLRTQLVVYYRNREPSALYAHQVALISNSWSATMPNSCVYYSAIGAKVIQTQGQGCDHHHQQQQKLCGKQGGVWMDIVGWTL